MAKAALAWSLLALLAPAMAYGAEYECKVFRKLDNERVFSKKDLEKWQYSVRIQDGPEAASLSRCGFSTADKEVTCDRYEVDKVVVDDNVGIKKFYNFRSQLDVQLYPDMAVVENNGRGTIAFGKCQAKTP